MTPVDERKLAEQVFNGSLAILAILIAVAGIVAATYEKVSALPETEPHFRYYLWFIAGLSVVSCIAGLVSLSRIVGWHPRTWLILCLAVVLLLGVAVTSVWLVIVTVF